METTYFKMIGQKSVDGKMILVAVVPDDMLGDDLPSIFEVQAFKIPATIYTGTYPQIKINTDTIKDRTEDLAGSGINGILTEAEWYCRTNKEKDILGIKI
jgi:hypothetical protein